MQAGVFVMLPHFAPPSLPPPQPLSSSTGDGDEEMCGMVLQKIYLHNKEAASFIKEREPCFACLSFKFRSPELYSPLGVRHALLDLCCFCCSRWTETFVCTFAILPIGEFARSLLLLFLEGAVIQTEGAKRVLAHYSSCSLQRGRERESRKKEKKKGTQASTAKSRKFFKETLIK